jgi:hypothetical protein
MRVEHMVCLLHRNGNATDPNAFAYSALRRTPPKLTHEECTYDSLTIVHNAEDSRRSPVLRYSDTCSSVLHNFSPQCFQTRWRGGLPAQPWTLERYHTIKIPHQWMV